MNAYMQQQASPLLRTYLNNLSNANLKAKGATAITTRIKLLAIGRQRSATKNNASE